MYLALTFLVSKNILCCLCAGLFCPSIGVSSIMYIIYFHWHTELMDKSQFLYLFIIIGWDSGYFYLGNVLNNTTVNVWFCFNISLVCLVVHLGLTLGYTLGNFVVLHPSYQGPTLLFPMMSHTVCILLSSAWGFLLLYILADTFFFFFF